MTSPKKMGRRLRYRYRQKLASPLINCKASFNNFRMIQIGKGIEELPGKL